MKTTIQHKKTGEIKTGVKSYGNGFVDAAENFYHSNEWRFYREGL